MRSASYNQPSYGSRTSLRSRVTSAVLAIAIGALLILGLMTLGVFPDRRVETTVLATFDVRPPAPVASSGAKQAQRTQATRRPQTPTVVTPPPPPPPVMFPDMIVMSSQEFAAADIGRIKPSPNAGAGAAGAGTSADAGTGDTVGKGPDGQPMYNAQWYREPTRAEMATYMPKRRVGGDAWGLIVCRTIARYRVDDCHELGESPGSGLAGAMRQAAWQFQIRPPRKGGQPMIGAWVRIRFDVVEEPAGE